MADLRALELALEEVAVGNDDPLARLEALRDLDHVAVSRADVTERRWKAAPSVSGVSTNTTGWPSRVWTAAAGTTTAPFRRDTSRSTVANMPGRSA